MTSLLPIFSQKYAYLKTDILFSAFMAGGSLLQWPLGKLSDRFCRRRILWIISFTAIAPAIATMLLPIGWWHYLLVFALGGACFAFYPIGIALVCEQAELEKIVQITGVLLFSNVTGSVASPIIVGHLIENFGLEMLFACIAVVCLIYGLFGLIMKARPAPIPAIDAPVIDVILLPSLSPIASQLDPRSDLVEPDSELENANLDAEENPDDIPPDQ